MFTWYSLDHFTSVMIHDSDCSFYFAFPPLCVDIIFSRVFADNFKQDHPLHPLEFGRILWSCIELCRLFAVEFGTQTANAGVTEGASIPMALPHVLCWLCHGGGTMIAAQDLGALHVLCFFFLLENWSRPGKKNTHVFFDFYMVSSVSAVCTNVSSVALQSQRLPQRHPV